MKKRKKIWIRIGIIVASVMCILLCFNVYSLYIEAEKAQKTAFTGNILTIGQDIVDKINSELANKENVQKTIASDSAVALTKETFLFDKQPVALIKETTIDYNGTTVILRKDTTYMSPQDTLTTDSLLSVPVLSADDSVEISEFSNLIINTINKTTLREYIANKLSENKLNVEFDFGIYNLPENTYVLAPKIRDPEMLKNGYVFALTHNQERSHSHYFILYFPSVRTYFLQRMSTIVLPIFFLLLSIMFLFILLFISFNQQKINEEVKNNFINNMTHEFKTPISTISLACEALTDESINTDKASRQAYISIIQDENDRLKKMVNNILQLALLRKGQLKLTPEKVNVHTIIDNILKNISLQVATRGGQLVTHCEAQNPEIIADKSHIENILINLIENALKYTPTSPIIEITTRNEKGMIVIIVKDNGVGIEKHHIRHIFDEFYRVSKGNLHDTKGYGLGLNYVKKIIQLHQGKIRVESEVQKGSIFTIYLPIKQ